MLIKKNKIYLYPITKRGKDEASNPYISNLITSLGYNFAVVNKDNPSSNGIIQMLKYTFRTHIFYFNWIENLPIRKGGLLQTGLLVGLLYILKLSGKKIIWTMHNKISHTPHRFRVKKFLFRKLLRLSDLVITHSSEGLSYGRSFVPKNNLWYFPHPVLLPTSKESTYPKKYDVLIWGVMAPYKGVDLFLKYLYENKLLHYRILIAGKFTSPDYLEEVKKYKTEKVEIINDFINPKELSDYINHSEVVLFTYHYNSVLSSGALMDTLTYYATIVGPEVGSFKDLADEGLLFSYQDFDQLIPILNSVLQGNKKIDRENISNFLNRITWEEFARSFTERIQCV